jgi:uncharacterized protein (DUF2141 family)
VTRIQRMIAAIALNIPALTAVCAADAPARLEIAFTGIETPSGAIMLALFDNEAAYTSGKPARAVQVAADKAEVQTLIEGLPAGQYAIKSFHDIDGDGKMGANPFGMPTEPFAFSNDAKGAMGPASWRDAAFEVKSGATHIRITIK